MTADHRGQYTMNDLQLLPHNDYPLWTSAPADGSEIRLARIARPDRNESAKRAADWAARSD